MRISSSVYITVPSRLFTMLCPRLLDIVHADQKLYLVFEFLDVDLKRFMEHANADGTPFSIDTVKVRFLHHGGLQQLLS